MMIVSLRATLIAFAMLNFSAVLAQDFDPSPVYEALFAQAERLGPNRTYYIREGEARSYLCSDAEFPGGEEARLRYCDDAEFSFPEEMASHAGESFGSVSVVIVDESYISGIWDSGCGEGWNDFHRRYPDAGDLAQVSQVAFNDRGDGGQFTSRLVAAAYPRGIPLTFSKIRKGSGWSSGSEAKERPSPKRFHSTFI